ncbi:hypothetical protein [Nocardioides sp.]|uniref:hypothetical protein n=1 Tax=Nocardioides sp. TaxID=35761 RepID=UPI003D147260
MQQPPLTHGARSTYPAELLEVLRIIVVAGVPLGIIVAGLGSRLAMYVLRVTSPDAVVGTVSDDGFVIGQVTAGGTYQLVSLGAALGLIGAAAYVAVAPWLIGDAWLRRLVVGVTAGAVVGALVIHPQGVDFTLLEPTWLAVTLFVTLPFAMGVLLTVTVDAAADPDSWTAQGRRRWILPVLLLVGFPLALLVGIAVGAVVAILLPLRRALLEPLRRSRPGTLGMRMLFAAVPVVAMGALASDLSELF